MRKHLRHLRALPAVLLLAGPPVLAQSLEVGLTRNLNGQPYERSLFFFTRQHDHGVLNLSRLNGTCPSQQPCSSDLDCTDPGSSCGDDHVCLQQVDLLVGQVAVIEKQVFCEIATCAGATFAECAGTVCPANQTRCGIVGSCQTCPTALALCLCSGGALCGTADAVLDPADVAFEDGFDDAANPNHWHLAVSAIDPSPADSRLVLGVGRDVDPDLEGMVADAAASFRIAPGDYVLFLKRSIDPPQAWAQCAPQGRLALFLEAPTCGIGACSSTGSTTWDTTCNGVDEDCDGVKDDNYASTGTSCGTGPCSANGSTSCVNGQVHDSCTPRPPISQTDATCNGIDDDCDGTKDEDFDTEPELWTPTSTSGAPTARDGHTLVRPSSSSSTAFVWGGETASGVTATGASYNYVTDAWTAFSIATTARRDHTAVFVGSDMIVWGGVSSAGTLLNTGARRSTTGTQAPLPTASAPKGRSGHTAISTGTQMIVWGGLTSSERTNGGGRYTPPPTDSWQVTSGTGAPSGRRFHTAVWTGTEMIIWGGEVDASGNVTNTGARYNPSTNSWTTMSTTGAATARKQHTAVWTGTEMIVWGGVSSSGSGDPILAGGRYHPGSNAWAPMSTTGVPTPRSVHTAVWDGTQMIVWGGIDRAGAALDKGGSYSPDSWTSMTTAGAPEARSGAGAAWLGATVGRMMVWGGIHSGVRLNTGGLYGPPGICGTGACRRDNGTFCHAGAVGFGCTPGNPTSEVCNGVDDDCDGTPDDNVPPVSGSPSVTVGRQAPSTAAVQWTPLASATHYDCVRGVLGSLRSSGGNFTVSTNLCVGNNLAGSSTTDTAIPAAGDAFWYLVRGVNSCSGAGTYNSGASRQVGSRDAEINAAPSTCP